MVLDVKNKRKMQVVDHVSFVNRSFFL